MDSKTPFDDDYEPKEELEAERSSDDEPSRTSGTDERLLAPVDLLASDFFQVIDPQSTGNSTYFQPEKTSPMHPSPKIVELEPGHQSEKGLDEVDLLGVPLHLSETSPTLPSDVDHQSSLQRPEEPDDASRLHLELNKIEVAHRDLDSSGSSAQKQVSDSSETPDSRRNIIAEESEVSFLGEATEGFNKESIDDSAMDMSGIGMSSPQRFDSESIIGSTVVPDLKHDWRKQLEPIAQFPLNQGHISEENSHQDDASQLLPSDEHQNIRQNTQEDSVSKHDSYNHAEASFQNADNSVQGADLIEGEVVFRVILRLDKRPMRRIHQDLKSRPKIFSNPTKASSPGRQKPNPILSLCLISPVS